MSIWQFSAVMAGAGEAGDKLSAAETDDIWEWMKAKENGN